MHTEMTAADPAAPAPEPDPDFALLIYPTDDQDQDVDLAIRVKADVSADRPASAALLHGLAILVLDQQGDIAATIAKMFPGQRPSELEVSNFIDLVIKEDLNDQPV